MARRRSSTADPSRAVRDRAALFLEAQDGPVSSELLASEVLGVRGGSETACASILAPLLGADPRFARTPEGRWVLGEPGRPDPCAREAGALPLRERTWAVWSIETERRAAAVVRIEAGRVAGERQEPGDLDALGDAAPEAAAGSVPGAMLSVGAWRRLGAVAAGGLPVSWGAPSLVDEAMALGSGASDAASWGSVGPAERSGDAPAAHEVFSLAALARAALGPPRPRSLERLAAALGLTFVEAATPLSHARLAAACLAALLEREPLRDRGLDGLGALLEMRAPAPPALEHPGGTLQRDLDALPHEPGVYRFFDAADRLLYVGKARDLRDRVGSYFASRTTPDPRTASWLGAVARIEHERSGSELEALLREASQIARRAPSGNRQLAVHERAGRPIGNLVLVQSAERPGAVRVALVKDGALALRIVLGPRGGGRERLREALERLYFPTPGRRATRTSAPVRRSRPSDEPASRALLLSWLRRQPDGLPGLDPTDDPGPDEACARVLRTAASLLRGETGVTYRS